MLWKLSVLVNLSEISHVSGQNHHLVWIGTGVRHLLMPVLHRSNLKYQLSGHRSLMCFIRISFSVKNWPNYSWFNSSMNDWQHDPTQSYLLIHIHQSHHYVLKECRVGGECCQSSPAGSILEEDIFADWALFLQCEVLRIQGAGAQKSCFHLSYHLLTALSRVTSFLTTNISTDAGRKDSLC